ncbi:LysR family transcriptional regulator [Actinomadura rudentiformis]|uniref:LysR family transcriptional regulator n=1 Tax=Actinomadura rudentiformis TaxID=359158 RepID=A0A6H9Z6Y0_9ACTN|nr:LysR family transcriptional regulator [Actinomadura rudentiformis]KAB2350940.1 LysR family transcriptional regulator [Actinomadura rudentiformis]
MLESRHIRTFQEVVREGSYSGAARALGYTQPAITQQMKALERAVGMPLFVRAGRGLQLTEAGTVLARHAEVIVGDLTAAQQQLRALARLESGLVRICAFPSANATLVPDAMARLLATHPGVRVELQEAEPPESVHRLVRGESDIALAFTYPGPQAEMPEELVEVPLMEDLLTVLLPTGHPLVRHHAVRLEDLSNERWIAGCPRCRANLLHLCAEEGFVPDIVFSTDDNLAVQSLVAAGVGIALMPALVLSFLCHSKVTGRVVARQPTRKVSAYVLRDHLRIPAVELVTEELKAAAATRVGC